MKTVLLEKEYCAQGLIYPAMQMYKKITVLDVDGNERPCMASPATLKPAYSDLYSEQKCKNIIINHAVHGKISDPIRWLKGQGQPIAIACYACLLSQVTPRQRILCTGIGMVVKTAETK